MDKHEGTGHSCTLRQCAGRSYFCSVELALAVIGGKWKAVILWHLRCGKTRRFGELKRQMPNVTQKMLTQQLRELESDGLIRREVFAQVPPRVEYSLTELGQSVLPVLDQLRDWGQRFEERFRELSQPTANAQDSAPGGAIAVAQ